ncbi:MAG: hypothetical protein JO101_02765 [Candidatus Eremiobacteraeota bacterium]|nr:hypothetical protein [Candidatus Eremiobacteraeota bacterium]
MTNALQRTAFLLAVGFMMGQALCAIAARAETVSATVDEILGKPAATQPVAAAPAPAASSPRIVPKRYVWRPGWDYTLDFSYAKALGNTGAPTAYGLPGGMDVVAKYRTRNQELSVSYFDYQDYPVGFSSGVVPVYLQGLATPIAVQNLSSPPGPINAAVKNKLLLSQFSNVFWIKQMLPIIVGPYDLQRWGTIGGQTDLLPIEIDGFPYTMHYRTGQWYGVAVSIPFIAAPGSNPRLTAVYTIAPQWLANLAGANVSNHPQLVQIVQARYHPTHQVELFVEPSLYPNYLPTDKWPQHYFTFIWGGSYKFGTRLESPFIQAVVGMGGAMNISPYGITGLYCQQLPCTSSSQVVPSLGGLHAAQYQLKIGIGTPQIIPL